METASTYLGVMEMPWIRKSESSQLCQVSYSAHLLDEVVSMVMCAYMVGRCKPGKEARTSLVLLTKHWGEIITHLVGGM